MNSSRVKDDRGRKLDRTRCDSCLKCVEACPSGAIMGVGKSMTVEEVMEEVESDILLRNSGGGVTISGGEPLFQWKFTYELLKACKEKRLHTALDTCGHVSWDIWRKFWNTWTSFFTTSST